MPNMKIERIYHHHDKWEEVPAGMWALTPAATRKEMVDKAIEFTGDHQLYGKYMVMVTDQWPFSCEHNLTALGTNRKAWLGHAACCMAIGCSEDVTREAWHHLSSDHQRLANKQAQMAIEQWERKHLERMYAEKISRGERAGCCAGTNIFGFRPVQQNLFEFLGGQGQHGDATPCHG